MKFSFSITYLPDSRSKFQAAALVAVCSFFILYLLQPFQVVRHGFTLMGTIRTINYALVGGGIFLLGELYIQPIFRRFFRVETATLSLLWYVLQLFLGGMIIFIVKNAWLSFSYLNWAEFWITLSRSFAIGVFPLTVLFIIMSISQAKKNKIFLRAENNGEALSIEVEQLLLLQSDDNYTSIYFRTESGVRRTILRGSLTSFEKQLKFPLVRCHRSFIINLGAVRGLKGNSQGYTVSLNNWTQEIRVSRNYIDRFKKQLQSYQGSLA